MVGGTRDWEEFATIHPELVQEVERVHRGVGVQGEEELEVQVEVGVSPIKVRMVEDFALLSESEEEEQEEVMEIEGNRGHDLK